MSLSKTLYLLLGNVLRLIKGLLFRDLTSVESQHAIIMSLSKTLYPLLSTGSTQEDRKLSGHGRNIVGWGIKHQNKITKTDQPMHGTQRKTLKYTVKPV